MAKRKKPGPPKGKGGKPSKFTEKAVSTALELAAKGLLDKGVAHVIGISPKTFTEWKGNYPEFAEALKEAREKPIELVEAALFRSAMGYTHIEEKVFCNSKTGKVTRVPVVKHYAPNPASVSLYLRSHKPQVYRETLKLEGAIPTNALGTQVKPFEKFATDAGYPSPS